MLRATRKSLFLRCHRKKTIQSIWKKYEVVCTANELRGESLKNNYGGGGGGGRGDGKIVLGKMLEKKNDANDNKVNKQCCACRAFSR